MPVLTRHVTSNRDRRELDAFILSEAGEAVQDVDQIPPISPSPTTREILIQAAVDIGWPRQAALESYDDLVMKGRLHEYREVAEDP